MPSVATRLDQHRLMCLVMLLKPMLVGLLSSENSALNSTGSKIQRAQNGRHITGLYVARFGARYVTYPIPRAYARGYSIMPFQGSCL